jgi:hypothetical protein
MGFPGAWGARDSENLDARAVEFVEILVVLVAPRVGQECGGSFYEDSVQWIAGLPCVCS